MSAAPGNKQAEDAESNAPDQNLLDDYHAMQEGSTQNPILGQVIGALALRGIAYGTEVTQAYSLLKHDLDPEKLLNNPEYARKVERAAQLVRKHEGKKNINTDKSKHAAMIKRTEKAIQQVKTHHKTRKATLEGAAPAQGYGSALTSSYGLNTTEQTTTFKAARARIDANSALTMQEALHQEAQNTWLNKKDIKEKRGELKTEVEKEFNRDTKFRNLKNEEKNARIEKEIHNRLGLTEKSAQFESLTAQAKQTESAKIKNLHEQNLQNVATTLGVELKPKEEKPSVAPQTTGQTQPLSSTPLTVASQTPQVSIPESAQIRPPLPKKSSLVGAAPKKLTPKQRTMSAVATLATTVTLQTGVQPKVGEQSPQPSRTSTWVDPSLQMPSYIPQQSTPTRSTPSPSLPTSLVKDKLQSKFSFSSFFKSLFGKSGGTTSAVGSIGKSIFSGGLKLGLSSLGKMGVKQALASVVPGVGNMAMLALDGVNNLIKRFTGVDAEGMLIKGAVVVVVCVITLLFVIPFFLSSGEDFSFLIGQGALSVPQTSNITTWRRFEREHLDIEKGNVSVDTWNVFDDAFLSSSEKQISER